MFSNQTIIRLGRYCIQASELGNKLQISSENGQFNEFHLNEVQQLNILFSVFSFFSTEKFG